MLTKRLILVACPALLACAGCGSPDAAPPAPGKVAARVNGTEITMQQVAALQPASASAGASAPASAPRAPSALQALDKIIDRELLVQQALDAKLDRDPQVAQSIEDARRQILAQAWLERAAAARARSTPEEVRAFYEENPALFAQRRIYRLREMIVTASSDKIDLVRSELTGAKDLDEVAGWLKWRSIKVSPVSAVTQAAEQLPLAYLPQLARMREGEIALFPSGQGATLVQVVSAQEAPIAEREAAPLIEQFLSGRRKLELAAAEVKRLRGAASIEYVGDFKR